MAALQDEIMSLEKNCTWDLVKLLENKKSIGFKYIFKRKEDISLSEPARYKVRFVDKGYSQISGIDFSDLVPQLWSIALFICYSILLLCMTIKMSNQILKLCSCMGS